MTVKNEKNLSIANIALVSFITSIVGGALATYSQETTGKSVVFISQAFSFFFGPFCATIASIAITTALSENMNVATLLLPAYIAIPTFYISWLTTHYLVKNIMVFQPKHKNSRKWNKQ